MADTSCWRTDSGTLSDPRAVRNTEGAWPLSTGGRAMPFANCYDDSARADAYARLEFPNTYYLAYRDLPEIIGRHVKGHRALDFGCGTGRSTRFARQLGFEVTGVDIAPEMIARAKALDPSGDYRLLGPRGLAELAAAHYDLALSVFPFDNIAGFDVKLGLLRDLRAVLAPSGTLINVVSSPEIYVHEWASFSTKDFPENRHARSGDVVKIVNTDLSDRRPVVDVLCTDASYRELYDQAGLAVAAMYQPLGRPDEPYAWVNETRIAPWTIYALTPTRA
jgi:SAM-dependent methyltransferase